MSDLAARAATLLELHRAEDRMQKLTDEHVKLVDDLYKHKETEILEV